MQTTDTIILNEKQTQQKIKRIAYQIYEANSKEVEVILAGINGNGFLLTQQIGAILTKISDLKVTLCNVYIDKKNPLAPIKTSILKEEYTDKALILIDDVLNSGTTLIYGVKHFLEVPLKRFKTAVLVNRNHKKYPIKADFKGLSLSTSIQEHVQVKFFEDNRVVAYLI